MMMPKLSVTLATAVLLVPALVSAGGWEDDWFANRTVSGGSHFKTQQRGYYSGGTFEARSNISSPEALVSITAPRITSGCGGISAMFGGMTYLDEDLIMEKLNRMATEAVPAIAFDTALKVVSKELSETFKSFEKIINDLNGIMVDECAMAQSLVDKSGLEEGLSAKMGVIKQANQWASSALGTAQGWYGANQQVDAAGGKPTADAVATLATGCPANVKKIFAPGSLLENIRTTGSVYNPYIRGLVGDVMITQDKQFHGQKYPACEADGADNSLNNLVVGKFKTRPFTGNIANDKCQEQANGGFRKKVSDILAGIATKMKTNKAFTPEEEDFINIMPQSIYKILVNATAAGISDATISSHTDFMAYGLAYYSIRDMHAETQRAIDTVEIGLVQAAAIDPSSCNPEVYSPILIDFKDIVARLRSRTDEAHKMYIAKLNDFSAQAAVEKQAKEQELTLLKWLASQANP